MRTFQQAYTLVAYVQSPLDTGSIQLRTQPPPVELVPTVLRVHSMSARVVASVVALVCGVLSTVPIHWQPRRTTTPLNNNELAT